MKKIILLLFTAVLILFSGCEKNCLLKKPKNLKSVDWENYNDVYTLYWNFMKPCSEISEFENKVIKIAGWREWSSGEYNIVLCDDPNYCDTIFHSNSPVAINIISNFSIQPLLDSCDFTKKCFITGTLKFNHLKMGLCCRAEPEVFVTDINDIYFE